MRAREAALSSIIAATYAVLVIVLAPISFGLVQVRLADALIPLSTVLGYPAAVGVTVGCFVGNLVAASWGSSLLNLVDAILGSAANFLAGYLGWKLCSSCGFRRRALAALVQATVISLIVGAYLRYLLLWAFDLDVPIALSILSVFAGSLASVVAVGVPLAALVERRLPAGRNPL
ncbi:MAG: QueT transporter family protein [Thermofilum sp.]